MKLVTAMPTKEELKQLQALPLDLKIARTQQRIREWVRHYGVNGVYISFSGGKDSTVLLHIARKMYPEIEAMFVNTGLEYPEIQKFVRDFPNVRVVYPRKTFKQVMTEYGYPLISKTVPHSVGVLRRNPDGRVAHNLFASEKRGPFAMFKWKPLASVDFCLSEKCCDFTKKEPAHRYSRQSGKMAITAQMACESAMRETQWLKSGCNAFDNETPVSNPMSFWIEQDILLYIKNHKEEMVQERIENIEKWYGCPLEEIVNSKTGEPAYPPREEMTPICEVYGDVVYDCDEPEQERFSDVTTLKLKTTGCSRTGCMFCAFGTHLERGETRFQRLARTHPKQYAFCIGGGAYDPSDGLWKPNEDGLGLGHVFDELNSVYGENFLRYKPLDKDEEDK